MAKGPLGFISYNVENDQRIVDSIASALKQVASLKIPFKQILDDFYRSEGAIFGLKGPGQYPDFQGPKIGDTRKTARTIPEAYDDYTHYQYRKVKEKHAGVNSLGYPLLRRTSRLAKSLTQPGGENIAVITDTNLVMGTRVPYGIYHQSDDPREKIPLRKFLFIGPESIKYASDPELTGRADRWIKLIENYVSNKISRGAGSG